MERERFLISLALALVLHFLLFLLLQLIARFEDSRLPEYSGPLFVQLQEEPSIAQSRATDPRTQAIIAPVQSAGEPTTQTAEPSPAAEPLATADSPTQAPREPTPRADGPTPAARPRGAADSGSQGPLQSAAVPSPGESPRRPLPADQPAVEDPSLAPPAERPQPAGGSQPGATGPTAPAAEPLPQAGAPPAGAASAEESPLMPLDRLDQALTQRAPESGQALPESPASGTPEEPAVDPNQAPEAAGITIQWEDPAQGREPTSTPLPRIPAWVEQEGLQLKVLVSFVLTPPGVLSEVKVEQSSGYPDVDRAVLEALRRWKFKPVNSTRNVRGKVPYLISPR